MVPFSRSRTRSNGATQTFRRPSIATGLSHSQRENNQSHASTPTPGSGVYIPPHLNSATYQSSLRNGTTGDTRYSKEQLLDVFRRHGESGNLAKNISSLLVGGWEPGASGDGKRAPWNRKDDNRDALAGPDICWDAEGSVQPLGLTEMTEEEKEVRRLASIRRSSL